MGISLDTLSEGLAFGLLFGNKALSQKFNAAKAAQEEALNLATGSNILPILADCSKSESVEYAISGGLAIHGAIIAVSIYVPIYCKIRHLDLLPLLEILFPVFMMCQAIGRWGNFVNQEAYGYATKVPWKMGIFDAAIGDYIYVHPTFFYDCQKYLFYLKSFYQMILFMSS